MSSASRTHLGEACAVALVLADLACSAKPALPPDALAPPLVASAASDAPDVPDVPDASDAGPPCAPPTGIFADALRSGATSTYRLEDTVDPHSTQGGSERTTASATFRITQLACDGDAWVASGAWSVDDAFAVPTQLPDEWRLAGGRLVENVGALAFAESDVARGKAPVCRTSTDDGPYGRALRRICVDRRGLVSLREENLHGPRIFRVERR